MDQLICLKEGEKKIENNDFFQDLCVLMENEEFKRFFDKHMNNWIDIKCSVTYMHLYNQFKSRYNEINDKELDNRIIVYLLSKIMKDKILRPWSINTIDKMLSDHKVNFFEEFESIMNKDLLLSDTDPTSL
jgi:predicted nucleic-acid-binding Zn-ribbon protein